MPSSVSAVVSARRPTMRDAIGSKFNEGFFDAIFRMQDASPGSDEEHAAEQAFQRACGRDSTPSIPGKRAYPPSGRL